MHAQEALERLMAGNRRYAAMRQLHPHQTNFHRQTLVDGQHPFAAILSCSDSRVPAEIIFDQGLGDLFIVRTAGHAIDTLAMASLEYAVLALEVTLLMVVGHSACGAVTAVVKDQPLPGHLPALAEHIRPALTGLDRTAGDVLKQAIRANTRFAAAYLARHSTIIGEAVGADRLQIATGYYDLTTGQVDLLAAGG
ncbi:MAG: carbonic anhydrase [Anaerolineae bacterium]|nr:carbonic anhydrase [Anaerolineae bacterium]